MYVSMCHVTGIYVCQCVMSLAGMHVNVSMQNAVYVCQRVMSLVSMSHVTCVSKFQVSRSQDHGANVTMPGAGVCVYVCVYVYVYKCIFPCMECILVYTRHYIYIS